MEQLPQLANDTEVIMLNAENTEIGKIKYLDRMPVHSEKISKEALTQLKKITGRELLLFQIKHLKSSSNLKSREV